MYVCLFLCYRVRDCHTYKTQTTHMKTCRVMLIKGLQVLDLSHNSLEELPNGVGKCVYVCRYIYIYIKCIYVCINVYTYRYVYIYVTIHVCIWL